jgi:hypothetical protein
MASQVIFPGPPQFVPEGIGDDDTFVAMATFRVLPGNKLELVAIEGHKIGAGALEQTVPPRITRTARRPRPLPVSTPGAAPIGAVPAVARVPGAPTAVQPGFAQTLAQRFRTATGR